jgi:hypothetical protein
MPGPTAVWFVAQTIPFTAEAPRPQRHAEKATFLLFFTRADLQEFASEQTEKCEFLRAAPAYSASLRLT